MFIIILILIFYYNGNDDITHTVRRFRINKAYHFYLSSLDFMYKVNSFIYIYITI